MAPVVEELSVETVLVRYKQSVEPDYHPITNKTGVFWLPENKGVSLFPLPLVNSLVQKYS